MTEHVDKFKTAPATDEYKEGWDRIFKKKKEEKSEKTRETSNDSV